jgi:arylformamidase
MSWIDVSLSISDRMLTWPGDPPVDVIERQRMARGDAANVSEIVMGSHTGTHVDPPFHFVDGAPTVDQLDLDLLIGDALVVDLRGVGDQIEPKHLEDLGLPEGLRRILFRTDNSELWTREHVEFPDSYTALSVEGARWLVEHGVRLVGIDFLSIERKGAPGHPTHVMLLSAGAVIVEGLDLSRVEPGEYRLMCLPLRIAGGDGAPARALLALRD